MRYVAAECFRLIVEMCFRRPQLCISLGAHEYGKKQNVAERKLLFLLVARRDVFVCYDVWERIFLNQITPESE